jgi:hypothetical protein
MSRSNGRSWKLKLSLDPSAEQWYIDLNAKINNPEDIKYVDFLQTLLLVQAESLQLVMANHLQSGEKEFDDEYHAKFRMPDSDLERKEYLKEVVRLIKREEFEDLVKSVTTVLVSSGVPAATMFGAMCIKYCIYKSRPGEPWEPKDILKCDIEDENYDAVFTDLYDIYAVQESERLLMRHLMWIEIPGEGKDRGAGPAFEVCYNHKDIVYLSNSILESTTPRRSLLKHIEFNRDCMVLFNGFVLEDTSRIDSCDIQNAYVEIFDYIKGTLNFNGINISIDVYKITLGDSLNLLYYILSNATKAEPKTRFFLNGKEIPRVGNHNIAFVFELSDFESGKLTAYIDESQEGNLVKQKMFNTITQQTEYFIMDLDKLDRSTAVALERELNLLLCRLYMPDKFKHEWPCYLSYVQCAYREVKKIGPETGNVKRVNVRGGDGALPEVENSHFIFAVFRERYMTKAGEGSRTIFLKTIEGLTISFDAVEELIHRAAGRRYANTFSVHDGRCYRSAISVAVMIEHMKSKVLNAVTSVPELFDCNLFHAGKSLEDALPLNMDMRMFFYNLSGASWDIRPVAVLRPNKNFDSATNLPKSFEVYDLKNKRNVKIIIDKDVNGLSAIKHVIDAIATKISETYKDAVVYIPNRYKDGSVSSLYLYTDRDINSKIRFTYPDPEPVGAAQVDVRALALTCKRAIFRNGPEGSIDAFVINFTNSGLSELSTINDFQRYLSTQIPKLSFVFLNGKNINSEEHANLASFAGPGTSFNKLLETETFEVVIM